MKPFENHEDYSEIRRLTLIGGCLDLFLGFLKVLVGFVGNSHALIADGIHSLSDLITDYLVLVATKQSDQAADEGHRYGHDRIKTLVSLALAGSLGVIATAIAWDAVTRIWAPELQLQPGFLAIGGSGFLCCLKRGVFPVCYPSSICH